MILKRSVVRVSLGVLLGLSVVAAVLFRSGDETEAKKVSLPAAVPAVSIAKSAALVAGNGDGDADPGDTIEYTITVNNSATPGTGNEATGVQILGTLQSIARRGVRLPSRRSR